jgi:uncharacterized membrane protein YecN with MAPEG domain
MTTFPVTALYAGLCGLLVLLLAIRVVLVRQRAKIGIGDGANHELTRCIRAHGNAVEYVPMLLILLGLCEAAGMAAAVLHGFGASILIARVLHAWGLSRSAGISPGRFLGTAASFLLLLILSLSLLTRPWLG